MLKYVKIHFCFNIGNNEDTLTGGLDINSYSTGSSYNSGGRFTIIPNQEVLIFFCPNPRNYLYNQLFIAGKFWN